MRVGIIGHGTLGGALARGLRESESVTAIESTTRRTSDRNGEVVAASDVVLVCVKPRDVEGAVRSIAPSLQPHHVVVSTAASVGVADVRRWSEQRGRVVRAMPNTPAGERAGMTVIARDELTCERALEQTRALFSVVGRTMIMDEAQMDAVTAISGCGPAFVFVMLESMIDAAVALGVSYERAREMVAQTMLGAATQVMAGDEHPAMLKSRVATPGGRTVRGLLELEEGKLRATISRAVLAAARPVA